MSLNQSESTILHENIIYDFVRIKDDISLAIIGFFYFDFELTPQNKRIKLIPNER